MNLFLSGMITMGFSVAGLLFFRFWRRTGDMLFVSFGIAFWLFALDEALLSLSSATADMRSGAFLPRLAGFVLIIVAIVRKNLS